MAKINLKLFFLLVLVSLIKSDKETAKVENKTTAEIKTEANNKQIIYSSSNIPATTTGSSEYVLPHINKEPEFILQHRTVIPLDNSHHIPPQVVQFSGGCPCAAEISCKPCGIVTPAVPDLLTNIDCPCAPKLNCPVCPPLSLIHEIASKKVKFHNM